MQIFVNRFFFSSRRRHTRLQGDWSSDVCSSDLAALEFDTEAVRRLAHLTVQIGAPEHIERKGRVLADRRSEERRVGKEGRYRLGTRHEKKTETLNERRRIQKRSKRSSSSTSNRR